MSGNCVLCTSAIENSCHAFVLCPFAILCRKEIKLDGIIYSTSLEVECFYEFLFSLLSKLNASVFGRFAMVLWQYGEHKNYVVWRDARPSASVLVHHALGFLYDWLQVRSKVGEDTILASRVCCK